MTTRWRSAGLAVVALALAPACASGNPDVREPAVAGQFYPASAERLRATVEKLLADAAAPAATRPLAVVVPHAGYVFSGQVAADGWRRASGTPPDLVVILGTNHTAPGLRGVAV